MHYKFADLVSIDELTMLITKMSRLMGISISLLEYPSHKPLITTNWCELCNNFFRKNSATSNKCHMSDIKLAKKLHNMKDFVVDECANGLIHASTPIIIDGEFLAILHIGQVFLKEPDKQAFIQKAEAMECNCEDFLAALNNIPVIEEKQFKMLFTCITEFAVHIADMGLLNKKLKEEIERRIKTEEALKVSIKQLEEVNKNKNNFLSALSHELRTPLTSILGFADLLISLDAEGLTKNQSNYITKIINNSKHLFELTNELLDLARIDTGKVKLNLEYTSVCNLIQEVLEQTEIQFKSKNIHVDFICADNSIKTFIDCKRFKQIIINLITNAIKYTPENGTITLDLSIVDDNKLLLTVSDTGAGISKEDLSKIFDEFYQAKSSENELSNKGLGLGLAITKKLVKLHEGKIFVESEAGIGTKFSIILPLKKPCIKKLTATASSQSTQNIG